MAFGHKWNKIPASFHALPDLPLAFLCTPSLITRPFVQSTPKTLAIFSPFAHLRAFCCLVAWGYSDSRSLHNWIFYFFAGSNVTFTDRSLLFILVDSAPFLATLNCCFVLYFGIFTIWNHLVSIFIVILECRLYGSTDLALFITILFTLKSAWNIVGDQ